MKSQKRIWKEVLLSWVSIRVSLPDILINIFPPGYYTSLTHLKDLTAVMSSEKKQNNFSFGDQDFSDTSVEAVLKLMPHPQQCRPVKGFFPESAKDIEERFVFVSLDTDLYEPIYNGLRFFYPRLVSGGYIFVHDFNNEVYKGTREAVQKFCLEQNINFLPIPDLGGSVIIMK